MDFIINYKIPILIVGCCSIGFLYFAVTLYFKNNNVINQTVIQSLNSSNGITETLVVDNSNLVTNQLINRNFNTTVTELADANF